MGNRESNSHVAVYFIGADESGSKQVTRHMLYSEFEALLDGLGTSPKLADTDAKAVYTVIDRYGEIKALVFFTLYFDEEGRADPTWNTPVERLATISGSGPDLGGGPVRLACHSQCSINWHQSDLWDPDMTPGSNDFLLVKKAVKENRLRLNFEVKKELSTLESQEVPSAEEDSESQKRVKLARLLKEQRLRIRTLEAGREQAVDLTDREQRLSLQTYKNEIQNLKQSLAKAQLINEKLQEKLSMQNKQNVDLQDKISGQADLVQSLEKELEGAQGSERERLERKKMEAELVLLREQLDRKEIDLAYRNEREDQLRSELEELKSSGSVDTSIIDVLKEYEVVYVAYHAGAGHITMGPQEIVEYAENPIAFVASKCFVTEENYRRWLSHFENPVCRQCHAKVEKISVPSEFEPDYSDYCEKHQTGLMGV